MGQTGVEFLPALHATPRRSTLSRKLRNDFTNEAAAGAILLLMLISGALAMLPVSSEVVRLWIDDPSRSFGALLPLIAVALWVRQWRSLNWQRTGTAWGLLPMIAAVLLARTYGASLIAYSFGRAEVAPVQPGLLIFAFGSGMALLLGGMRLWRPVLFPLCLLLCVNPVPHLLDKLDLPLQEASAGVARAFSHAIGLHPSGVQLQMMFAPRFGLVIVPGCNGVRGSATMAYLALLLGYLRGFRWQRTAAYMAGGLLLGYLLNFARLCCLVVYYRLAMNHPEWHTNGEQIDYLIGGTLFVLVASLAGFILLRPQLPDVSAGMPGSKRQAGRVYWAGILRAPRWAVAITLLLIGAGSELPAAWAALRSPGDFVGPSYAAANIPDTLGTWHRQKTWTEIYGGRPVWLWSSYSSAGGRTVDMGVWLSPKRHYAIQSLLMNGSRPATGGGFDAVSGDGVPMQLSTYTLNDASGESRVPVPTFFAETMCLPGSCSEQEIGFKRHGWLVAITPAPTRVQRHLPVLYRVQAAAGGAEDTAAQQTAKQDIADLAAQTRMRPLVESLGALNPYRN